MSKRARRDTGSGSLFKRSRSGPWQMEWTDELGVRRRKSSGVREKAVAGRMLAEIVAEVAKVSAGLLDRAELQQREQGRRDIREHLATYLAALRSRGLNEHHLVQKERQIERLLDAGSVRTLKDLSPDVLEVFLGDLKDQGLSARTQNQHRQQVIAFANWCQKTGKLPSHRLSAVPRRDEARDRRKERRALTD